MEEQILDPQPGEKIEVPLEPQEEPKTEEPIEEPKEEPKENEPSVKDLLERIDKQNSMIEKMERRQQYLQRKFDRPKAEEKAEPQKPKQADFENYDDYVEALTDYKTDQKIAEREKARREEAVKREREEKEDEFRYAINSGSSKYSDFNEVALKKEDQGGPSITGGMIEAMLDCDNPVDIVYHLGKNVALSRKLAGMSPIAAAREIGKLDYELSKKTPQRTTTHAPSPTKPVGSSQSSSVKDEDLPIDEYIAKKNREEGLIR